MKIIRNIIVAFALYSKVPMPIFEWKKEDMELNIAFLPLVGLMLGMLEVGGYYLGSYFELSPIVKGLIWVALIFLFTGGFHVDGYMDVSDALRSYKSKEEKLIILKDPHIGAFAVISLVQCGCIYLAAIFTITEKSIGISNIVFAAMGFCLVRAIAGILAVIIPHAKKDGMLHEETKQAGMWVKIILAIWMTIGILTMLYLNLYAGLCVILALSLFCVYFRNKCIKEFGGITGDCSGYFIVVGELIFMVILAIFCLL